MRHCAMILTVLAMAFLASSSLEAEQTTCSITNADIVEMIAAKIGSASIVKMIDPSSAKCLDGSPQALIALSKAGADQTVLDAVIAATRPQVAKPAVVADTNAAPASPALATTPGLPETKGVYIRTAAGKFTRIEEISFNTQKTKGVWKGVVPVAGLVIGMNSVSVFRGASAATQFSETRPAFYVRDAPTANAIIVQLKVKGKNREVLTGKVKGIRGAEGGYQEKDIRETSISRVSDNVVTISPKAGLAPGEYILILSGSTFDFGIK